MERDVGWGLWGKGCREGDEGTGKREGGRSWEKDAMKGMRGKKRQ